MKRVPESHGHIPQINGKLIQELIVQQYWYDGQLCDSANLILMKVAGDWHTLCIDDGVVCWKTKVDSTKLRIEPFDDYEWKYIDIGEESELKDIAILEFESVLHEDGTIEVVIRLAGGRTISLLNSGDDASLLDVRELGCT